MRYVKIADQSVHTLFSIMEIENVSVSGSSTDLEHLGYLQLLETPKPAQTNFKAVEDGIEFANGEWQTKWTFVPFSDDELRSVAKRDRAQQVEAIQVTTQSGKTFDGDETSQNRMARAILALQATGTPTVTWVLADNTSTQATVAELSEALALAGAAQAAIWVI